MIIELNLYYYQINCIALRGERKTQSILLGVEKTRKGLEDLSDNNIKILELFLASNNRDDI